MLMEKDEYKNYLQLDNFSDYISIPQKFAVDKINQIERQVKKVRELVFKNIFDWYWTCKISTFIPAVKVYKCTIYRYWCRN